MNGQNTSRISNVEWGLVIGALAIIDTVQIGLDLVGIGFFINWIVDALVGMSFAFYLQIRGESLADGKRLMGLIVAFFGGELTGGAAPLWVLDGVWCWFISKGKKIISEVPVVSGAVNKNNVVQFPNRQTDQEKYRGSNDEQLAA